MVYGIAKMLTLHGDIIMVGGYTSWYFQHDGAARRGRVCAFPAWSWYRHRKSRINL
ncbi:MAG: hypothetical protein ACLRSW_12180 [Christensenellaceae bacterium]